MVKKICSDAVVEEICDKAEQKDIMIYGAGNYGRVMCRYLNEKKHRGIKNFLVTSENHIGCERAEGIDIISIDRAAKEKKPCVLIIAVSEQKQSELLPIAQEYGFTDIYLVLNEFLRYMASELTKKLEPLKMLNFEVHVTDHCNLNCKGCYHFSPLASESCLSTEEFERDFEQMHRLCGDRVSRITLLGGEPLLHPQIIDFFYIARRYFGKSEIELLTNGTLLNRMDERFWDACVENRIHVSCTKYPVQVDYDALEQISKKYDIHITYHNDTGAGEKTLIKYPFDLSGTQPIEWNYEHCTRSNRCITLKHGRIFTCPMAAHAHLAKDYFGLDMELSDQDSIDIYSAEKFEDITEFLVRPIPFCRYCNLKVKPEQQEWGVSVKDMSEWF